MTELEEENKAQKAEINKAHSDRPKEVVLQKEKLGVQVDDSVVVWLAHHTVIFNPILLSSFR